MKKREQKSGNAASYVFGGLTAFGAHKVLRSLIKATVTTKNPIVGVGFLALDAVVCLSAFAKAVVIADATEQLIDDFNEAMEKAADDDEYDDDEDEEYDDE